MTVSPTQYAKIRVLADSLIASCDGGVDQADQVEALTLEECRALDSMALECQVCNQWFAANEMRDDGGEYVCIDCSH